MKKLGVARRSAGVQKPFDWIGELLLKEKLNNWLGAVIAAAIALVFGYLFARQATIGLSLLAMIVGFFTFLVCVVSAETGLYISIFYSFFAFHFSRYYFNDEFPVGIVIDLLLFATFLGLLKNISKFRKNFASFVKTPVAILMLILTAFMFLQLFNFYGHSFEGWLQTFRRFFGSVALLFIAYYLFDDYKKIRRYLLVIFCLAVITALYGCIQEWFGLFEFERYWVTSNENRFGLYFIMGDFRKFSTMSDPTSFAIAMAVCSIVFLIMAWHAKRIKHKIVLAAGCVFMLLAMAFSGTRTANIMVVGGLAMFVLLSMNKKQTQLFAFISAMVFLVLMYGPYANSTIIRFRSSFQAKEDGSFQVREANRKVIQPYIWSHPIGGGLGTSGAAGLKFNSGHYLAGFPPDSGYLRKAIETGWVGLALIMITYFTVLLHGIRGYFRSKYREHKLLYAAAVSAIFSLYIGEFAQEAIGQISDIVLYYPLIAMILKLNEKNNAAELKNREEMV